MPTATAWRVRGRTLQLDRPLVMGILNVTPDSFSDGGRFFGADAAVEQAERMAAEGADIIDVGGESTRPQGATPVSAGEEIGRVGPVLRELRRRLPDTVLSVDTVKSEVAREALAEGAEIVNDVSGFRLDARMAEVCAAAGAGAVLMHSRGGVSTMGTYQHAEYGQSPVDDVLTELRRAADAALAAGLLPESVALDPGVGFAKRSEHSLAVLGALPRLVAWGFPVVVGVSRKRFIGELTGVATAAERVHGTVGANVAALSLGARIFRVHDVRASRQALDVAWAVLTRAAGSAA
ncbi:MAG TPA: dihydropteroate synthase [Gemmatimonadaceae bacterium]|nr:dihydropteroate synthase [Gemmatimonadaceae bacterium]